MDLSKIPFLKNLDLSNAQTRKSALMLLGGVVAILVFILLNIPRTKDGDADVQNQAATQSSQAPPIQDGADKDNLRGKTLIEVRERKNDNGSFARRIFDDSNSSVEDILRGTDSQGADPVTAGEGGTALGTPLTSTSSGDLLSNIESMAEADFQSRTSDLTAASSGQQQQQPKQAPAPAPTPGSTARSSSTKTASSAGTRGGGGSSRKYSDDPMERKRQHLVEMGFDPDTGLPLDQAAPEQPQGTKTQQTTSQKTASTPPDGVEKSVVSVRGKGSMSSFGTGNDSGSGFSSFGSTEQEAVSSGAKFFKVAFAYDEKIKAGQRVTLRLKEKITVNGYELPLNSIVYATSSIEGERLILHVRNIDINGKAFFLNYDAIDVDWEKGLYCPSKQSTKKVKEAVREGIQVVSSAAQSVITGVPGRILSSGTSMVQSDSGEVTVTVREGYEFYLVPSEE